MLRISTDILHHKTFPFSYIQEIFPLVHEALEQHSDDNMHKNNKTGLIHLLMLRVGRDQYRPISWPMLSASIWQS